MNSSQNPLIVWTEKGLYCQAGNFYIDPHKAVEIAIVTHAHSDHARRGAKLYICEKSGVELLKTRLGSKINVVSYTYGEKFKLGSVIVSLHSAGHILGSAQVRIESSDEVWVSSGDYKRDADPSCEPFEPIQCDTFITEATFGTPSFVWEKNLPHGQMIFDWWKECAKKNKNALLFGYSLGKAQRILAELAPFMKKPVLIHDSIHELTECYRRAGKHLASTMKVTEKIKTLSMGESFVGELVLAPPSILKESWSNQMGSYETAFASGWMNGKNKGVHGQFYDQGFVMSDHADWNDLNQTIVETRAKRIYVQHRNGALIRHLKKIGLEAYPIEKLNSELVESLSRQLNFL
ncbi:MAG: ligase-associated DNA damage response exonuclease [Bacteriovoracaceae bacterium]